MTLPTLIARISPKLRIRDGGRWVEDAQHLVSLPRPATTPTGPRARAGTFTPASTRSTSGFPNSANFW